jgi:drug/metabolite transporter (DMT)-like permease
MNRTHRTGLLLAAMTAMISGVAVFLNTTAVRAFGDPALFTTAKNAVAGVALLGIAVVAAARRPARSGPVTDEVRRARRWLPVIAVIGGSVPFLLFFEGLSRATSTDAAFLHKTLVIWVAIMAVPLLGERIRILHVAAIALLMLGQAAAGGGIPDLGAGSGEGLILAATLLWSVEVVVVRRTLTAIPAATAAAWRMAGGGVLLIGWTALQRPDLAAVTTTGWLWALLTGVLLTGYVATWYAALERAPAVDVSAVLVGASLITTALAVGFRGAALAPALPGAILVLAGLGLIVAAAVRRGPVRT